MAQENESTTFIKLLSQNKRIQNVIKECAIKAVNQSSHKRL